MPPITHHQDHVIEQVGVDHAHVDALQAGGVSGSGAKAVSAEIT